VRLRDKKEPFSAPLPDPIELGVLLAAGLRGSVECWGVPARGGEQLGRKLEWFA